MPLPSCSFTFWADSIVGNTTNDIESRESSLNVDDIFEIIKVANFTGNQTIKVSNILKKKVGKNICPSLMKKKLCEQKKN